MFQTEYLVFALMYAGNGPEFLTLNENSKHSIIRQAMKPLQTIGLEAHSSQQHRGVPAVMVAARLINWLGEIALVGRNDKHAASDFGRGVLLYLPIRRSGAV